MSSNQPQGANDLDFTFRFRDCKRPNEVADLKSAFPPKAVISLRRTKRRFGPLATFCSAKKQRPFSPSNRREVGQSGRIEARARITDKAEIASWNAADLI